ncbi:MAG: V-type ATPase 116kDa subunit family protein [Thermodesulfobacteriota bacterium]|nr:V-type ATPase 116kDa subunit family protein [Thermodesulfobacteriota bacterium]
MIVKMNKVTIVAKSAWVNQVLDDLRELGVLHINPVRPLESEKLEDLREQKRILERALSLVPETAFMEMKNIQSGSDDTVIEVAEKLLGFTEELKRLEDENRQLKSEYDNAFLWGEFEPKDIQALRKKGVTVRFFQCRRENFTLLPEDLSFHIISKRGETLFTAIIYKTKDTVDIPFQEVPIPDHSLKKMESKIKENQKRIDHVRGKISHLISNARLIKETLNHLNEVIEFEETKAGMGAEGNISYLVGFCPEPEIERLRKKADEAGWGLLVEQPSDEERVPTLIRYSKWARLFKPVMDFLGVVPGYREYDTNALFLVFFSIFFAILIGDAGYGMCFLALTFLIKRFLKNISRDMFRLLFILSGMTVFWGAVTGMWFGVEQISGFPVIKDMIITPLYTFARESERTVIHLCFIVGAVQLSIAHAWAALRNYPSLSFLSELGWMALVWGIYWIARFLVLSEEMNPLGLSLTIAGMSLVVLFGSQGRDGLIRGFVKGLTDIPINALTGIGSLSDLVSYIRLFAVGLATKEVAVAFNNMAADAGSEGAVSVMIAVFILIFGHTVNIILAAMAVLIHGIRLNLLEFSRHLHIEWSGIPFRPFKVMKE